MSSKFIQSFLIIFATSYLATPTHASSNTSIESSTMSTIITTTVPMSMSTMANGSDKEEKPRGDPLTLQLVENSTLLLLHLYPMEDSFEMTIKFDLEQYKTSNYSNHNRTTTSSSSKNDKKSAATLSGTGGVRARKINIGFDGHEGKFVDVISISLLPFEETENHEQSKTTEEEVSTRGVVGNDHVQDFHWSPKDGVLLPDSTQSYNLVTFNVENNGTIFSTTISRPWLTCDIQDVQFSLQPIEIWWMIEMSDGSSHHHDGKKMLTSNLAMFEKLEAETTTLAGSNDKNKPTGSPPTTATVTGTGTATTDKNGVSSTTDFTVTTSRPGNNNNTAKNITSDKNATTSSSSAGDKNDEENSGMEKDAEVLKSIKDHDFHGPVLLSMEKLLGKFNAFFVKGCPTATTTVSSKKKKSSQPLFNCSLREYKERQKEIQAYLRIAGVVSSSSSSQPLPVTKRNSFTETEPEPCPISFDNKTTTLFYALTGGSGNDRQPKRRKNGGSESRNSVTSSPSPQLSIFFSLLLSFIIHYFLSSHLLYSLSLHNFITK